MREEGVEGKSLLLKSKPIAFVLSGGGNFGALQAGALEALIENGIVPDIVVGTSAGALNAVFLAVDPSLERAKVLSEIWAEVKPEDLGLSNPLAVLRRLVQRKPSFYDPRPLREFFQKNLPPGVRTFKDLKIPAFTVSVNFSDGSLRVFGDDPEDLLLDGMLASSAIPPYFPPHYVEGVPFVDGGALSNLPLKIAVERGAKEIFSLQIEEPGNFRTNSDMLGIVWRTISFMLSRQMKEEFEDVSSLGIKIHQIPLSPKGTPFFDFTRGKELVSSGKAQAEKILKGI